MRAAADEYARAFLALLPPGDALSRDADSIMGQLALALAGAKTRAHNRALDLIDEADPRTTLEMLSDFERMLGLPDDCTPLASTVQARRAAVVEKLTRRGGQTAQFYVDMLAQHGYTASVKEYRSFRAGASCGGDPVAGADWDHAWNVTHAQHDGYKFIVGQSVAGEPLGAFSDTSIGCLIEKTKPVHTSVIFSSPAIQIGEDGEILTGEDGAELREETRL